MPINELNGLINAQAEINRKQKDSQKAQQKLLSKAL